MPKPPETLSSIDPSALAAVTGGRGRGGATSSASDAAGVDPAVMTALTGILDSLKGLAAPSGGGLRTEDLMLFMLMLNSGGAPAPVAPSNGAIIPCNTKVPSWK